MTLILFFAVCLLAIWMARGSARASRLESLVARLTSRIFNLEEELKQLQTLIRSERPEPAPHRLPEPTAEQVPPVVQMTGGPPRPTVEPTPKPVKTPVAIPPPPPPVFLAEPEGFSPRKLLNLEETLGANWLNKLGIIILVIGIALFLTYEVREMGPAGKVLVGFAASATMLGAGVFFERREQWRILARAGIAGGWALVYFTTYAMYHVPAARILSSEGTDLTLLLLVAAGLVLHTLRYDSQVVTGLAFLLAFTTVNLSRGDAYSLIASAFLAAALAWVALRRRWFEMEIAGMAGAYLNHYLWLRPIIEPMHGHIHVFPGYAASAALLYGYWLIFRASYVLRRVDGHRQELISTFAALLNPALFIAISGYQSVHPELAFQFFLSIGAVEFVTGQLPITRRRRSAFVVLTTLGSCLLIAAFPYRYAGARLSANWLAEAAALLMAGVFLREILFRRLGLIALLAAFIQMVGSDAGTVFSERMCGVREGGQPGLALLFALAAAVFYISAHWIPRRWANLIQTELELLCFRRLSHLAGILAFIGAWIAWPHAWTAVAWAALGVALAAAGRRWRLRELSIDAAGCAAAATLRVLTVNLSTDHERLLTVSLVVALLYLGSRWAGVTGLLTLDRISPAYTWAASALAGLLAWYELRAVSVALGWALVGMVLLEIGVQRQSKHLRAQAYLAFAGAFARLFFVNLNAAGAIGAISPRVYTTAPLALAFYYVYARLPATLIERRYRIAECHCFFGTITLAALLRFELDLDLVVVAWAALALVLVAISWKTGRRVLLDQGLLMSAGVLFRGTLHNLYERSYFPAPFGHGRVASMGTTVALLFLALPFAFKLRCTKDESPPVNPLLRLARLLDHRPEQVFFFVAFVLLTSLLAMEIRTGLVTLAWGVEAVAVFLVALRAGERSYRLAGLGLLLLCVARIVFHDVWGLAPRDRYLTFIVLGSALLAVSYLYTRYRDVVRQYL